MRANFNARKHKVKIIMRRKTASISFMTLPGIVSIVHLSSRTANLHLFWPWWWFGEIVGTINDQPGVVPRIGCRMARSRGIDDRQYSALCFMGNGEQVKHGFLRLDCKEQQL
jgi:hypothetical protein